MKKTTLWDSHDCCLILIDYQEEMFSKIKSGDPEEIELKLKLLVKAALEIKIPVILSTVGVSMGVNQPTRRSIADLLPDIQAIDRSTMNAWEDENFKAAVKATKKKRLIFCALMTEFFRDWKDERATQLRPLLAQHYQDLKTLASDGQIQTH